MSYNMQNHYLFYSRNQYFYSTLYFLLANIFSTFANTALLFKEDEMMDVSEAHLMPEPPVWIKLPVTVTLSDKRLAFCYCCILLYRAGLKVEFWDIERLKIVVASPKK